MPTQLFPVAEDIAAARTGDPAGTDPVGTERIVEYQGQIYTVDPVTTKLKLFTVTDVDSRDVDLNRNAPTVGTIPPELVVLNSNDPQDTVQITYDDFIVFYATADGTTWQESDRQDRASISDVQLFQAAFTDAPVPVNVETPTLAESKALAESVSATPGSPFRYNSPKTALDYAVVSDGVGGINLVRRTKAYPTYAGSGSANIPDELHFLAGSFFFYVDTDNGNETRYEIGPNKELIEHESGASGVAASELAALNARITTLESDDRRDIWLISTTAERNLTPVASRYVGMRVIALNLPGPELFERWDGAGFVPDTDGFGSNDDYLYLSGDLPEPPLANSAQDWLASKGIEGVHARAYESIASL